MASAATRAQTNASHRKTPSARARPAAATTGAIAAGSVWGRAAVFHAWNRFTVSIVPGESAVVGVALLEERIPALLGFLGHVAESGRLAREDLLTDQAVVDEVEGELEHALGHGGLAADDPSPLQCDLLQVGVWDDGIDHAHGLGIARRVVETQEEDLARLLLTYLAGQVGRPVACVERGDVGVGLLEDGVLLGGDGQVTDHVQAVPAAHRPAGHDGDDDLGHEADEPLHLEDVETTDPCRVDAFLALILVAVLAPDSLVAAGAERPAAVL